jgi:ALG6, ALG8 glycosyltransferase family
LLLQMSLYYAPAFFSHLLGKCFKRKYSILHVMKLGFVVLATFALVWWPYIHSLEAFLEVSFSCNFLVDSLEVDSINFANSKPLVHNYMIP